MLAGGQSLMAMLNLRYVFPDMLVDINRIPGLAGIAVRADATRIGAMTRQSAIERDAALRQVAPIFAEALPLVGHRQTRNRGTIGGSLCHLDPAAELPTLALLYDMDFEVAAPGGTRTIPASSFIAGFMSPGIEPSEILAAVHVPHWAPRHGYAFREFSRRHGDFAVASAASLVERDGRGAITRIALAIGGVGSVPQRATQAERLLLGTAGESADLAAALDSCEALELVGDFHGGADYRLSVARAMLRKSLAAALDRASSPELVA